MKIVFFTNNLDGSDGWSRYSLDLVKELHSLGHDILCLVNKKSDILPARQLEILDKPLRYLANPFVSLATAKKVKPVLSEFKPDIIHIIAEPYATILPFMRYTSARTIMTIHGTYAYPPVTLDSPFRRFISHQLTKNIYHQIDAVIAVSRFTKERLLQKFSPNNLNRGLAQKIKIIGNGIDLESFSAPDFTEVKINTLKQILFVGGVKSGKGLLESLAALVYYKNNFSEQFVFNIVGNYSSTDSYYLRLKKLIAEEKMSDKIIFHGRVGESALLNFYRTTDLFLMPSLNVSDRWLEGFGLVYLEANSQGVPCIGSKESGATDAILDGETGYLVDARDPIDIAEKIDLILNKRTIKSENCITWARKNDIKNKVQEIINLYNYILL